MEYFRQYYFEQRYSAFQLPYLLPSENVQTKMVLINNQQHLIQILLQQTQG
jgi:hypothetical protein